MAVNQFRQRLMAAGASPERADGMLQQREFAAGAPMGMPTSARPRTGGQRPKGPSEWYSEDYAAASQSLFPQGFRPPSIDDDNFVQYFDVVYGKGSYNKFKSRAESKAFATKAPTYNAARKSTNPLDQAIVPYLGKSNVSLASIVDGILKNPQFWGGRTAQQAEAYATKLFNEYNDAIASLQDVYAKEIAKNKDYKFGLPDPKLRYGATTNLSAGTVDILTNPTAAKAYASFQQREKDPAKLSQYKNFLVSEANKRQLTPWRDEAKRRDFLKGKKIK